MGGNTKKRQYKGCLPLTNISLYFSWSIAPRYKAHLAPSGKKVPSSQGWDIAVTTLPGCGRTSPRLTIGWLSLDLPLIQWVGGWREVIELPKACFFRCKRRTMETEAQAPYINEDRMYDRPDETLSLTSHRPMPRGNHAKGKAKPLASLDTLAFFVLFALSVTLLPPQWAACQLMLEDQKKIQPITLLFPQMNRTPRTTTQWINTQWHSASQESERARLIYSPTRA